jgi:hypothetical protein|tara:strand:- start:842 stop:1009 length:168 start_codon:yes stop_codon:yes gene_type:complete
MNQKERMKKEYPYKNTKDKRYIKDKKAILKKNGNGWWYYQGCYKGQEPDYAKQEG